jgi:hypothetical protein
MPTVPAVVGAGLFSEAISRGLAGSGAAAWSHLFAALAASLLILAAAIGPGVVLQKFGR